MLQGSLFNHNIYYLSDETIGYIYQRIGWFAALMNISLMHIFGKYVFINLIVAFMKNDMQMAVKLADKERDLQNNEVVKAAAI